MASLDLSWTQAVDPSTGRPFGSQADYEKWVASNGGGATTAPSTTTQNWTPPQGMGWTNAIDPNTGRPFESDTAYNQWLSVQPTASGGGGKAPEYNWSTNQGYYTDPSTGNIYFGVKQAGFGNYNSTSVPEFYKSAYEKGKAGTGFLDPKTGKLTFYDDNPYTNTGTSQASTGSYSADMDYGLGSSALGVIPIQRDPKTGIVTAYWAGVAGGGGQVFTDLASAQASAKQYKTWYDERNPSASSTTQTAGTPTTNTQPGILTTPRAGEQQWEKVKGFFDEGTNAQKIYETLSGNQGKTNAQTVFEQTPNQPSAQEQYWNGVSGIYANPNYYSDYYKQQQAEEQTALERRAASAGVGDSGAAMRATGNLGAVYSKKAIEGMQDWTKTGMGLAGAADTGLTQRVTTRGGLASTADTQNLAKTGQLISAAGQADTGNLALTTAGLAGAGQAQALEQGRLTGAITSATSIANDMATLTMTGLSSANAQKFQAEMEALALQVQSNQLTADAAYKKAQEMAAGYGAINSTMMNYYIMSKLGK